MKPINIHEITKNYTMGKIIAWTYSGSTLYNLATEQSDTDIAIITEGRGKDRQHINGEIDLRITPIEMFMKRLWDTSIPETDLLMSRAFDFTDSSYRHMLESFRPNAYQYFYNSEALAMKFLPKITPEIGNIRREYKMLKACTRSIMLAWKMLDQGENFDPRFDQREQNEYWSMIEYFQNRFQNGDDWKNILNDMHYRSKSFRNI